MSYNYKKEHLWFLRSIHTNEVYFMVELYEKMVKEALMAQRADVETVKNIGGKNLK